MAAASAHAHNASASLAARGVPGRDQVDGLLTSEGTIYPLLTRLRKEQLVTTFWQESASGPPRRLEAAAADLPQERRIELLSEIEEHIEAALRERGRPPCATCSSASDRLTGTAMRTGRSRAASAVAQHGADAQPPDPAQARILDARRGRDRGPPAQPAVGAPPAREKRLAPSSGLGYVRPT
jgi:hypothetical protein